MVRILVEEGGADVNQVDADGDTPLHGSAKEGCREVVEYLLTLPEVDIMAVDMKGKTAAYKARGKKHHDIANLIGAEVLLADDGWWLAAAWHLRVCTSLVCTYLVCSHLVACVCGVSSCDSASLTRPSTRSRSRSPRY
jgi:hypothetical protein